MSEKIGDREVRFCCKNCVATFHDDEAGWFEKLDAKIIAAQTEHYPLETCIMSGRALDIEGAPIDHLVGNRLVRVCHPQCAKNVDADPAAVIAELDAAVVSAQGPGYTATTCPISGGKPGRMGDPVEIVFNGELVRLCCPSCIEAFYADPVDALAALHPAESDVSEH